METTHYRKVSVKERLPKEDGVYICFISCCEQPKEGCSTGWGDCNFQDNTFLCPEEKVLYWLEETPSPANPSKSIEECLDEVAKRYGFENFTNDFDSPIYNINVAIYDMIKEAMQLYFEQGKREEVKSDAVEFAEWVADNYAKVYSEELKISKFVSLDAPIYIHGSDSYRTQLVHAHGKTTEQLYSLFKQETK